VLSSRAALVFAPTVQHNVFRDVALKDGRTLVASINNPARPLDRWDVASAQELSFGESLYDGKVDALALDPDGEALEVGGDFWSRAAAASTSTRGSRSTGRARPST
jgi:hypothetical protein